MSLSPSLGVRINDLDADVRRGLRSAVALRFSSAELAVDRGQATPETLSESGRRHLAKLVQQAGLGLVALARATPGRGLADAAAVDEQVSRARQALRLAADMGVPILAQDIGLLHPLDEQARACVRDALRELGREADRLGTVYAIRGRGAEPAAVAALLAEVSAPGIQVSIDPASLLAWGLDPTQALATHAGRIALAYLRDASPGSAERAGVETPLGEGALDLPTYLASLEAGGRLAPLILHRGGLTDPVRELAADADLVRRHLR
jgi:sugar phosphate isomerase/epimerase